MNSHSYKAGLEADARERRELKAAYRAELAKKVAKLLEEGLRQPEIAERLSISRHWVFRLVKEARDAK